MDSTLYAVVSHRTHTGSRWWLMEKRVCWISWILQVRRSTVQWETNTWGLERVFYVSLPSTIPSLSRTFISTGSIKFTHIYVLYLKTHNMLFVPAVNVDFFCDVSKGNRLKGSKTQMMYLWYLWVINVIYLPALWTRDKPRNLPAAMVYHTLKPRQKQDRSEESFFLFWSKFCCLFQGLSKPFSVPVKFGSNTTHNFWWV